MFNKKKFTFYILILIIIDLLCASILLSILLTYSILLGNDALLSSPYLSLILFFIFLLPFIFILYYVTSNPKGANELTFEFSRNNQKIITKKDESLEEKKEKLSKGTRFSTLLEIDNKLISKEIYDESITYVPINSLKEFCDNFRNFCASGENPLFYTIDDIRSFISNLATSKTMILQGMSGTGKTSLALAFERFVGNETTVIPVQPMWKERSDLIGYYNEFTKKFNETPLLKELYRSTFSNEFFIIVLDEMNIARVEYYFAEFLSLLEYPNLEERTIEVTNDAWPKDPKNIKGGRLKVNPNVFFIGTANNDESTFSISDKVCDRAMIMNLNKIAIPFKGKETKSRKVSYLDFEKKVNQVLLNEEYDEELENWINKISDLFAKYLSISFGNRMINQIRTYVPIYEACGGNKINGFDDYVSKKILRKIEGKERIRLKDSIESLLNDSFMKENMSKSNEYLLSYIGK